MGGLGNQMFQYAFARSIALRTGAEVVLDTSVLERTYAGVTRRVFALSGFSIVARVADSDEAAHMRLERGPLERLRKGADRILPLRYRRVVEDRFGGFNAAALRLRPPVYLSGYWQSEKYFIDHALDIRREFSLRQPLSARGQEYLAQIREQPSVSVHVRRGDYMANPANLAYHGVQEASYYRSAIQLLVAGHGPLRAFVFSDDRDWAREHLQFDARTTVVELTGDSADHEEIHLMASCDHHVISNSSFGWWGAWLGANEHRQVVAPQRWFAAPNVRSGIVPERWTRI